MDDRDIVAAIVARDPAGLEAAYDNDAAALHAYCRTLLATPADALDAVQDTFVVAAGRLDGLRDRSRLRPWLYAVARNECHGRLRHGARQADVAGPAEMTFLSAAVSADVGVLAEHEERRGLVLDAIGGMVPGDREVIELNLRHDLDGVDLADVLGVSVQQAHTLAARVRGQLERSLGALLVARTGRWQCAELDALLAGWDDGLTAGQRRQVAAHIEDCPVCTANKLLELSPAMLASALPLVTLPADLRRQVMALVTSSSPDAVRYRRRVIDRAEPFGQSGFPVQIAPAAAGARSRRPGNEDDPGRAEGGEQRRRHRAVVLAAAALLILVGGGVAYRILGGPGHGSTASPTAPPAMLRPASSPAAASAGSSSSPAARKPSSRPGAHSSAASPSPPVSASASTSAAPPASAPPRPPPASAPASTRPAVTASLSVAPSTIALTPAGGQYSACLTLTASGAPETFTVSVPGGESYLSASPASGTLQPGQSATITVILTAQGHVPYTSTVQVSPGGTVTVLYPPSA